MRFRDLRGRGVARLCFALAIALPSLTAAQTCTQVNPPVLNFDLRTGATSSQVTADGRVAIMALPNDAPESAAAEVALFNPRSGTLNYLTSGTPSVIDIFGERQRFTKRISAVARDGSRIAITGAAASSFSFVVLPGNTAPTQVEELVGVLGPAELIDTQSGARQTLVGGLGNVTLGPNQVRLAQITGISPSSGHLLIEEQILQLQPTVIDGRTRLLIDRSVNLPSRVTLLSLAGQQLADISQAIFNRAGVGFGFAPVDTAVMRMSGDGNAFVFAAARDVVTAGAPFWTALTSGGANISLMPYIFFRNQNLIVRAVDIDVTQQRLGGSSQVFLRNVGFSGTVFGIERGVSYPGAPPNTTGANAPATLVLDQPPQYVVAPGPTPPARGFFANSFAFIAPEEDRVYFQHTGDLVPGGNPNQSQEFFSIDRATRQVRQISRHADPLAVRFASEPNLLFQYGDVSQIVYAGSSADHSVVAYTYSNPGGFTRTVKQVDSQGRTTLRAARFGTAELPASEFRRIMVCQ